jgi:rhodanese-related sulfurtransferase
VLPGQRRRAFASRWRVPTHIERERLIELVKAGAQLVEVLPAAEYAEEHLRGAINIPLRDFDHVAPERLDRNAPIIVYCSDFT